MFNCIDVLNIFTFIRLLLYESCEVVFNKEIYYRQVNMFLIFEYIGSKCYWFGVNNNDKLQKEQASGAYKVALAMTIRLWIVYNNYYCFTIATHK